MVSSLAKAHQASGLLTEVILPKYDCIQYGEEWGLSPEARLQWVGALQRGEEEEEVGGGGVRSPRAATHSAQP